MIVPQTLLQSLEFDFDSVLSMAQRRVPYVTMLAAPLKDHVILQACCAMCMLLLSRESYDVFDVLEACYLFVSPAFCYLPEARPIAGGHDLVGSASQGPAASTSY